MDDVLKAWAPMAIAAAVILVCITILVTIAAAIWGKLDIETGAGKLFSLRIRRQPEHESLPPSVPRLESGADESISLATGESAVSHDPVPQEGTEANEAKEKARDYGWERVRNYFTARTIADLDTAFTAFIEGTADEHMEFWQTDHLRRREELGVDGARKSMQSLADQNPAWAMPHSLLVDWALSDHDYEQARKHLENGLTKTSSPQFGHLLNAGVRLFFKAEGKEAALRFASTWSKADVPESMRADTFNTAADLLKDAGDIDGCRVALEYASILQPTNENRAFSLAYSYAQSAGRWAPAIWYYERCLAGKEEAAVAQNNIGILFSHIDKAVAVQTYEEANKAGDLYAAANLAHLLIRDGYVAIAEALLDTVADPGPAAENHAAARAAALTSRGNAEKKRAEITAAARANVQQYKASLANAMRTLQRDGDANVVGPFATIDCHATALIDGAKAFCQVRVGVSVFEGSLINQATCYAGWLSRKGGTLLTAEVNEFTLLKEGSDVLTLIRWPSSIDLQIGIKFYQLKRAEAVPELAPPPRPTGLLPNAFLRSALLSPE